MQWGQLCIRYDCNKPNRILQVIKLLLWSTLGVYYPLIIFKLSIMEYLKWLHDYFNFTQTSTITVCRWACYNVWRDQCGLQYSTWLSNLIQPQVKQIVQELTVSLTIQGNTVFNLTGKLNQNCFQQLYNKLHGFSHGWFHHSNALQLLHSHV